MYGIGGIYFKKKIDLDKKERFKELLQRKSRGPQNLTELKLKDNLYFFNNGIHTIDVNKAKQPMEDEEGIITFNGVIYNYESLRERGINYKFKSDTEVLLKGLNKYYLNFLNDTNSMFGFAYYNKKSSVLTLAKDRVGMKQVYYIETDEVFAFSSTLTPLVIFSQRELNSDAMFNYYLNRSFKAPETIFKDIKELTSGEYLEFDTNKGLMRVKSKWYRIEDHKKRLELSDDKIISDLDSLLTKSIQDNLVSDVKVGTFLSGGVDSSLITAIATKFQGQFDTFTLATNDKEFDESKYAKVIAKRYDLKYNEVMVDGSEFLNAIDEWVEIQDDIVAEPASVFQYRIAKYASELGYKVMLSGEGADELFGGYGAYKRMNKAIKYNKLARFLKSLDKPILKLAERDSRIYNYIYHIIHEPRHYGPTLFEPHLIKKMFDNDNLPFDYATDFTSSIELDMSKRVPNDLLTKTNKVTMAANVEARFPFLSSYIYEYVSQLQKDKFINNGITKYYIKKLAENYIPHETVHRKKMGFEMPVTHWLRNELKDMTMNLIETSHQKEFLNIDVIKNKYQRHLDGKVNAAGKIWTFISLELSYRYLKSISSVPSKKVESEPAVREEPALV